MSKETNLQKTNESKVYTLYYAFFLIPLMITIFGVMFFFMFRVLTYESSSPVEYLTDVQYGAASKRWQAAYELSKLLSNPDLVPLDRNFQDRMISVYEHSIHDDPTVRMYLALAMGRTGQNIYGETLIDGLRDKDLGSRVAAIKALGNISYKPAIEKLVRFTKIDKSVNERLSATISLGNMEDKSVIPFLENLLNDEEPNVRWDASIALAKYGNKSGVNVINNLLDRRYYDQFKEVDSEEKVQAILIAIKAAGKITSIKLVENLLKLATLDPNMKIRDSAIKTLDNSFNMEI